MRTTRGAITLAETRPLEPRRRLAVRLLVLALVAVVGLTAYRAARTLIDGFGAGRCQATALGRASDLDTEQMSNAATITAIAVRRGLPARAATIALATALTESKLRNLRYGDRDSLGLFQQRPSQGWGTEAQILDPEHATNAFYDALITIKGYESMDITTVAQRVQRSAYPLAYAAHEQQARTVASALSGHSPGGLGCRLAEVSSPGSTADVLEWLKADYGITGRAVGRTVVVSAAEARTAWSVGAWAVAKADQRGITSVQVGSRRWTRGAGTDAWSWHPVDDGGSSQATVVISLE